MGGVNLGECFSVFKNKRVLITGDTGFKGSWLSLWLYELGADVVGFALPPKSDNDHFVLLGLDELINHFNGDIRELDLIQKIFDEFQPEFVFHLAAQPIVKASYDDPKQTFDTNIGGSVNILEACRSTPSVRSLIYVTSDKCYRNKEWVWAYRENDELGGHDPYSASKAAAEIVFSAYWDSFFEKRVEFGAASVRAGNVIGGGDWAQDRIVPDCIRSIIDNRPIRLRNPLATRPWQIVLEPLSGYMLLASRLYVDPKRFSGGWNFGPTVKSAYSVGALTEEIIRLWGKGEIVYDEGLNRVHEANLLQLNCDKSHLLLGWESRWGINQALSATVEWYKKVSENNQAISISRKQIFDYMRGAND